MVAVGGRSVGMFFETMRMGKALHATAHQNLKR